jgi:hypothetical protein
VVVASAALFAAHLAFIAAASCARRSGERLSFLLGFLALPRFLVPVVCAGDFLSVGAVARAADFLAAFSAFAASACWSFCFSLASFFGPSCKRFSSRRIFFSKFFSFMIVLLARKAIKIEFRVKNEISLMSRSYHNEKLCIRPLCENVLSS